VTVHDGEVSDATGLDDSARRMVRRLPDQVPTLGDLLRELDQARRDDADTAEAEYADDGHPVRISLDWDADAVDDEAEYVISAYEPGPAAGQGGTESGRPGEVAGVRPAAENFSRRTSLSCGGAMTDPRTLRWRARSARCEAGDSATIPGVVEATHSTRPALLRGSG